MKKEEKYSLDDYKTSPASHDRDICFKMSIKEAVVYKINRQCFGYTFRQTVEQNKKMLKQGILDAISSTKKTIRRYKHEFDIIDKDRINFLENMLLELEKIKKEEIQPHDCSIDYEEYMMKNMTIEEICEKFPKTTIGVIMKAKSLSNV